VSGDRRSTVSDRQSAIGNPQSGSRRREETEQLHVFRPVVAQRMIERIRDRVANPTDDLLSDLVTSEVDGDRLEDLEVLSMALGLLVAGNESTRATLGNGMAILAQRPELAETLRADASRIPQFVEEVLRYDPPVQMLFRVAKEAREVGGTVIPKGARVAVIFASGNRDPKRFEQPATFEPSCPRQGTHLAFGHGEHHCIGAALARAELRVGFGALLDRMDDIRPARADDWFRRTASVTFRGFHELHVAFGKR
jgi:cytochrome P450